MIDRPTFKEIDSFMLEELVGRFEHRPHGWGNRPKLISQTIDELIHVVKQV